MDWLFKKEKKGETSPALRKWQRAPSVFNPGWSREAAFRELAAPHKFLHMARTEIIAKLGEPWFTSRTYFVGNGPYSGYDVYALSRSGTPSLHMAYNESEKLSYYDIKPEPFTFIPCDPKAPRISQQALLDMLRLLASKNEAEMTVAQLGDRLSCAGKCNITQEHKGGQLWSQITHSWRIRGKQKHYLVIFNNTNKQDLRSQDYANLPVTKYAILKVA